MTYGLSTSVQLSNFLFAAGFGFLDGVLYFVIVLFRKIASRKKNAVIVQDIIFGIVTSVLCFVFMQVYCNGQVRIDLIIAASLGFFLLVYTVGKKVNKISDKISDIIRKSIHFAFLPLITIIKIIKRTSYKILSKGKKIKAKAAKAIKKERTKKESRKKENKNINKQEKKQRKFCKSRRKINKQA